MAFEWDDIQTQFLQRRLGPRAHKLETKYTVAGSQLEIDLVLERPAPEEFFDFLSEHTLVENKAPDVTFSRDHLYRCAARAMLYAERESLPLKALEGITQLVLCSRATGEISRFLPWSTLRPGIREAPFVTRLVLVEANRLEVEERAWEVLVHYASGAPLRAVIETLVDREVQALYTPLWMLRREAFKEVLAMKGKSPGGLVIDIRGAIEDLGLKLVIEELGLKHVVEEVGVKRVVEEVGVKRVVEEVGVKRVVEELGVDALFQEIGLDEAKEALRRLEARPKAAPRKQRKAAPRKGDPKKEA